jgi:hypothetical protein
MPLRGQEERLPTTHEIRVRPVVRYVISHFTEDAARRNETPPKRSIAMGEYASCDTANRVAAAVAFAAGASGDRVVPFEPVPPLRIERGATGWLLREEAA